MNAKYRRAVIAGNWKMNMLTKDVRDFSAAFRELVPEHKWCDVMLLVPATLIPAASRAFRGTRVTVGAQNMSAYASGAHTGEVSAALIKDAGAQSVIIGHSERRAMYGDTDEAVRTKLRTALDCELRPILCVGESASQRETGVTRELIAAQLKDALYGVTPKEARRVIVAYEPIWAIGTGNAATAEDAETVCRDIRAVLRELFGARVARAISVLYGGSVTDKNATELFSMPDIDGALIGGASLDAGKFAAITQAAREVPAEAGEDDK